MLNVLVFCSVGQSGLLGIVYCGKMKATYAH